MKQKLSKRDIAEILKTAKQGDGAEYFELGIRYLNGFGVKPCEAKAYYYFCMAEYNGFISRLFETERFYLKKTDAKSIENFRKSVKNADVYAYYLGFAYQHGIGTGITSYAEENAQPAVFDLNGVSSMSGNGIIDEKRAIKMYRVAAKLGLTEAMVALGNILVLCDGKNVASAIKLYEKAASKGNATAAYNLGVFYETDKSADEDGHTDDVQKSIYWYQKAIDLGNDGANFDIGNIYLDGNGVEKDVNKAIEYFTQGSKAEDSDCITALGSIYHDGDDVEQDYEKAFCYFKKGAKLGNGTAQMLLADYYHSGRCVAQDDKTAFKWYLRSAKQGIGTAQYNVALFYEKGEAVEKNNKKALNWYLKAAENGDVDAQYDLGEAYDTGSFVEKNDKLAFKWYLTAAENGNAYAMQNLACCYMNGQGTEENADSAREWFERAAENGIRDAYLPLGNYYYYYPPFDYKKGLNCFMIAAENGDVNALNNLGIASFTGRKSNAARPRSCRRMLL